MWSRWVLSMTVTPSAQVCGVYWPIRFSYAAATARPQTAMPQTDVLVDDGLGFARSDPRGDHDACGTMRSSSVPPLANVMVMTISPPAGVMSGSSKTGALNCNDGEPSTV